MERSEFLKISGLTASGLALGLFNPLTLLGSSNKIQRLYPELKTIQIITIDKTDVMWVGWLGRLVASSLVAALGAKIVDKISDCYCNGTSCSVNNAQSSQYNNAKGIYGYDATDRRLVTQEINDSNVQFTNMSAPFLSKYNGKISNVEGPFLAGLC
jgi:hypothetical protein